MASGGFWRESDRARLADEFRETGGLFDGDAAPERRDAVVAAPHVVFVRIGPLVELLYQSVVQQALDRAVERARADAQLPVRARGHVLHDGVAVALAVGDGDENVERGDGQRHTAIISTCDISGDATSACREDKLGGCQFSARPTRRLTKFCRRSAVPCDTSTKSSKSGTPEVAGPLPPKGKASGGRLGRCCALRRMSNGSGDPRALL